MTDEQPVFVDGTGKRRKLFQVAGGVLGVIIAGYAIALGVSLGTGAGVPLTTWVVPEKKTGSADDADFQPKSAVPSAVPQPSVPLYIPPVPAPTGAGTPTETPSPTSTPTKTVSPRPTTVTKSPKPATPSPPETVSPSPTSTATPTATPQPPETDEPGDPPVDPPPGQEKKTAEE